MLEFQITNLRYAYENYLNLESHSTRHPIGRSRDSARDDQIRNEVVRRTRRHNKETMIKVRINLTDDNTFRNVDQYGCAVNL
ncbi:jg26910 [Pararge aegeria aegeria]|uniref:Jg26910 protein n=1 Tax=Pararge aegeria aegeria TaxID=348720 RepID=A0A8S4R2D0_9NEOP|nr:jg26910 [Pararge aegeria aegeria]